MGTMAATIFPNLGKEFAGSVIYSCLARGDFLPVDFYEHHVNCGDYGFTVRAFSGSGFDGRWDSLNFTIRSSVPVSSSWDSECTKEQMRPLLRALDEHGGGCPDWITKLVEQSERVMRWGIYEHGLKPSWASPGGKIVLLGDAAHAMAPYLGMGAQSALLDAHVLAHELGQNGALPDALQAYQTKRKGLCEDVTRRAKFEGLGITSFGVAAAYRNNTKHFVMRIHQGLLQSSRWYIRKAGNFLLLAHTFGFHVAEMVNVLYCFTSSKTAPSQPKND